MKKQAPATKESVRVVCRVRPQNNKELSSGGVQCLKLSTSAVEVNSEEGLHAYPFDRVYGPESTQGSVFEYTATPLIHDVLHGYNATIFAYGQTGTGKTFTMEGNIHDAELKGIIPRSVEALFEGVAEADEDIEFTFKVSYVEIYMEKIRDLLDDTRLKNNLIVREDKVKGIYIAGVTEEYVTSHEELLDIMNKGANNRATAATGMNEGSSRSHSVFTITVGQRDLSSNITKSGKLVLVDLAGSEMVRKTHASGQQLEEAKTINKSLSALGQVIYALTDEKSSHIPYRDSKLTRILQDSLGGNAKTVLIIAISPSTYNLSESISTLRFGSRAKNIENKVTVNQTRSMEELESLLTRAEKAIDAQSAHIMSLTAQLQAMQSTGSSGGDEESSSPRVHRDSTGEVDISGFDIKQAEIDAARIAEFGDRISTLNVELEEERQESSRKDDEIAKLAQRLKDKEHMLQEAGDLLQDAQRQNESHRERSELLVREKASLVGELENIKAQVQEQVGRSKFELQELEVTADTLRAENRQLRKEISEMSGDAMDVTRDVVPAKVMAPQTPQQQSSDLDNNSGGPNTNSNTNSRASLGGGQSRDAIAALAAIGAVNRANIDECKSQLEEIFKNIKISGSESASDIWNVVHATIARQEETIVTLEGKAIYYDQKKIDFIKKVKDMDIQRHRLEKDLQTRAEKVIQQQILLDSVVSADANAKMDILSERERAQMKSLQQRLEQLVAVHRQLLRKFATLELENVEQKKKIQLRDERIRQLESSSRTITGNMRQQAERHVAELTSLREQIQTLRVDHQQRIEAAKLYNQNHESSPIPGPRTVRGGANTRSVMAPLLTGMKQVQLFDSTDDRDDLHVQLQLPTSPSPSAAATDTTLPAGASSPKRADILGSSTSGSSSGKQASSGNMFSRLLGRESKL